MEEIDLIGHRIRAAREALRLSQEELGSLVGVSSQSVQQWESGKTTPRPARMRKLASTLKTTPDFLQFGTANNAFASIESSEQLLKSADFRQQINTAYAKTLKTALGLGWISIKRTDMSAVMLSDLFYSKLLEEYGLDIDSEDEVKQSVEK